MYFVGRGLAPAVTTEKAFVFGGTKAPPYGIVRRR